jgi:hypothetical protein
MTCGDLGLADQQSLASTRKGATRQSTAFLDDAFG